MLELIMIGLFATTFFCVILMLYSWIFRVVIKINIFNGLDKDTTKEFIKKLSFKQRVFFTYINKCNPTGKQRLGIAIWYIIWHYVHIIAVIIILVMFWQEIILELYFDQIIDTSTYIIVSQVTYNDLQILVTFLTFGALPVCFLVGLLIDLFSKNKFDLQTIKIKRKLTPNLGKSGVYNVFTSTRRSSPVRIRENEIKEFKVVKGGQKFWISQHSKKSNKLDINVQDFVVELEVGCDEDNNLWIKEKSTNAI